MCSRRQTKRDLHPIESGAREDVLPPCLVRVPLGRVADHGSIPVPRVVEHPVHTYDVVQPDHIPDLETAIDALRVVGEADVPRGRPSLAEDAFRALPNARPYRLEVRPAIFRDRAQRREDRLVEVARPRGAAHDGVHGSVRSIVDDPLLPRPAVHVVVMPEPRGAVFHRFHLRQRQFATEVRWRVQTSALIEGGYYEHPHVVLVRESDVVEVPLEVGVAVAAGGIRSHEVVMH